MEPAFTANEAGRNVYTATNDHDGSTITVYQQGAHLTSWKTRDGEEHLYTSPKAVYTNGKAIRGGIPLIFPQFSDLGPLPMSHGFLRVSPQWSVASSRQGGDGGHEVVMVYDLAPGQEDVAPEMSCALTYTITFTATTLVCRIDVANRAASPLVFSFAFHSYFGVSAIEKTEVLGLDETNYLDDLQDRAPCPASVIRTIAEEVDRIYVGQKEKPVVVKAPHHGHADCTKVLEISGTNFEDVVLWNPWVEKTAKMSDMPSDGYKHFICVEHANITQKTTLPSGASFSASQKIVVSEEKA